MRSTKIILVLLISLFFLIPNAESAADDHSESGEHSRSRLEGISESSESHNEDHGNEATGQFAIWLLVAANLTVVTSVLTKGANRLLPITGETKKWLIQNNQIQKKYLKKFHYYLNFGILVIALLHWSLSRCGSTSLPEWGLVLMLFFAGLGAVLKFQLAPQKFTKTLYKLHTHPAGMISIAVLLLAGHLFVD